MITPATSSAIGGVELNGILGGGTATNPSPPDGYITSVMLEQAYALAAELTAEIARATGAEAELLTGYSNALQSAITYAENAITIESNARVSVDTALQTQITAILNGNILVTIGDFNSEVAAREGADNTLTASISSEVARAESAEALLAPLDSPAITGTPTAPTATPLTDNTQISTTRYTDSAVAVETQRAISVETENASDISTETIRAENAESILTIDLTAETQRAETAESELSNTITAETSRAEAAESLLAPLNNPHITGIPTVPTASPLTNTTQVASTAYSDAAVAVEKARAIGAESTNSAGLANEITRAETAESILNTAIITETSRAEGAEDLAVQKSNNGSDFANPVTTIHNLGAAQDLPATAILSGAQNILPGQTLRLDISTLNGSGQLPAQPADKTRCAIKIVAINVTPGTYTASLLCGNGDYFNAVGGATILNLSAKNQGFTVEYKASDQTWTVQTTDTPLNTALGAARLGTDGTLFGPSASPSGASSLGGHYETAIGNGSATSFVINHNLGVEDVNVTLVNTTTNQEERCLITVNSTNQLTLSATAWTTTPPATNAYRVAVDSPYGLITQLGTALIGVPNGLGTLDATGRQPIGQVPTAVKTAASRIVGDISQSATVYLTTEGNDANDGLGWGTAKATLAGALATVAATGGVIQLGAGTFPVASASRSASISFTTGTTVVDNTASMTQADVGSYVVGGYLNAPVQILSVTDASHFTVAANSFPTGATSTDLIVKPGFVLPPGVEIRGQGSSILPGSTSIGAETQSTTTILDTGNGITCLVVGVNNNSHSALRYGLTNLSLWGQNTNLFGIYLANAAWDLNVESCDVSYHGEWGIVLDNNVNMFTMRNGIVSHNGTAAATIPTGGVCQELYANDPSSMNVFENVLWIDNYGYGLASGVNTNGATAVTLIGCGFNNGYASSYAGSGAHAVLQTNASGVAALYNTYFEGAATYNLIASGPVSCYGCGFHADVLGSHAYNVEISGQSGLSLHGCWFDGASTASVNTNNVLGFSWDGCYSADPEFCVDNAGGTIPAAAAAIPGLVPSVPHNGVNPLSGTTAGAVTFWQDRAGAFKRVVARAAAYENATGTAQTITFPVPFATTPIVVGNSTGMTVSVTNTTLTLPAGMAAAASGALIIEGS